ncbi:glycosyltransferase family 52 protein [Escherichia coli]|uniref:glycosyltransferase family 52 n=1 Tax=Escherichia coli TaxID=562 RepID=UPI0028E118EF|nr:glycosyltransferase family 52 [Escherichia coli]MDT9426944.1 glycosyltransferase family 52 protein [Escherichia coli]
MVADVMILTQPLSEDGFISENEKIRLYDEIIKEYNDKKIVIRQHPRELTDYSLYFKDVKVNKVKAPVELVVLNSPMIKTAVTLFSGGIFNIPCREKYSKEHHLVLYYQNILVIYQINLKLKVRNDILFHI